MVVRVERDKERQAEATPSDTRYGDQWSLPQIGWDDAFGSIDPSGSAVVAVLDTGVDGSHPDIDGRLVDGISQIPGQSPTSDPNGHGTWMAGIVAAETDNGSGIAGVGYNGVRVMPVTVLGADGTGQDSDVIEGVVWATGQRRRRHPHGVLEPRRVRLAPGSGGLCLGPRRRPRRRRRERRLERQQLPGR